MFREAWLWLRWYLKGAGSFLFGVVDVEDPMHPHKLKSARIDFDMPQSFRSPSRAIQHLQAGNNGT